MNSVEKSARTREEAIEAALSELNATISEVEIEVLDEGSKGLFGLFGSRLARVRVTRKHEDNGFEDDELDVAELLGERRQPTAPEKPREPRRPQENRPAAKPRKAEQPRREEQPRGEEPAEAEKPKAAPKKQRPEPVRRVNPDRKPQAEAPAEAPKAAEPAEEAPEAYDALTALPEEEQKEAAPARKRRRSRRRGGSKPAAAAETAAQEAEAPKPEKKPLPPKAPARPLDKPVVTMIPAEELDPESQAGRAKAFLLEVTRLMGVEVSIEMGTDEEGNVFGYMTGDTLGILIGRRGETLDALQYLTSLRINRAQDHYTRVTLDTENYRAKREDTLVRLANRMANRAVKTGRRVSMEPMNPYERRIIHSALQSNENVDTHSEGEDPNRHVVITIRK